MVDFFVFGYGMLVFLEILLNNQFDQYMQDFEQCMVKEVEVMQCYFVFGEYDYFLVVYVIDMDVYYQFVRCVILGLGNVCYFQLCFLMKWVKFIICIVFDEKVVEVQVCVFG